MKYALFAWKSLNSTSQRKIYSLFRVHFYILPKLKLKL